MVTHLALLRVRRHLTLAVTAALLLQALKAGLLQGSFCGQTVRPHLARHGASRVTRFAKGDAGANYLLNNEITALEVRVIGMVAEADEDVETDVSGVKAVNEVMSKREALELAQERGLDLILVNEAKDPPLVKIASAQKVYFAEQRLAKEQAKLAKVPKIKEVKMSYNIGDSDFSTRVKQCQKWMKNSRQQVTVKIVLKGRAKMFENQGREVLEKFRREVATFARVSNSEKATNIVKDMRGDLSVMISPGPDRVMLKQMLEEAGGRKAIRAAAEAEEEDDEEEEEEGEDEEEEETVDEDPEVARIKEEMKEVVQELLDCGVPRGKICMEFEYRELEKELNAAKKAAAANK